MQQVPNDAEVIAAQLRMERKERIHVPGPSSTFAEDVQAIHGEAQSFTNWRHAI